MQLVPQLIAPGVEVTMPLGSLLTVSVKWVLSRKDAPTVCACVMLTRHDMAVPVHAPVQPLKDQPDTALALSVTEEFASKAALQFDPQLMPEGKLVTVPDPCTTTCNPNDSGPGRLTEPNLAVTTVVSLMVTVHVVLLPEQSPAHPSKRLEPPGRAVKMTEVPEAKE